MNPTLKEVNRIAEFLNSMSKPMNKNILSVGIGQGSNVGGSIHLRKEAFEQIFDSWRITTFDRNADKLMVTIGNVEVMALDVKEPLAMKDTLFEKPKVTK